jgi:hypothetical protein
MSISDDVRRASAPRDAEDVVSAIKTAMPGRGAATKFVAEQRGVGIRQAQRIMAGDVKNYGSDFEDMADASWFMADALQNATMLGCGSVEVYYNGKSQGRRSVGNLSVDGEMSAQLAAAAAFYLNGDEQAAEQALSNAILGGYARDRNDRRNIANDTLTVGRFHGNFEIS